MIKIPLMNLSAMKDGVIKNYKSFLGVYYGFVADVDI